MNVRLTDWCILPSHVLRGDSRVTNILFRCAINYELLEEANSTALCLLVLKSEDPSSTVLNEF